MAGTFRCTVASKCSEQFQFLRHWIARPRTVGSIAPTSKMLAQKMVSLIDLESGLPVLELGPGTGAITRQILDAGVKPQDLTAIEYSADFFHVIQKRFPGVNILRGDAFDLKTTLADQSRQMFDCAISGLPLLNFAAEERVQFVSGVLRHLPAGRPLVQFSYGPKSPVPECPERFETSCIGNVIRNVPPARVWVYRRNAQSTD